MNEILQKARYFACIAHGMQMYGTDKLPYIKHLEDVYNVMVEYGISDIDLLVASYLHDIIEDTTKSYNDIKKEFGMEVAELVYVVTDELGRNRKERHEKTYPKLQQNGKAIILKLADRIANLKHSSSTNNGDMLWMYGKEYKDFRNALFSHGGLVTMWQFLDDLFEYKS